VDVARVAMQVEKKVATLVAIVEVLAKWAVVADETAVLAAWVDDQVVDAAAVVCAPD